MPRSPAAQSPARQVVQDLRQAVVAQAGLEVVRLVVVGEEVLDRVEAGAGRRLETLQERHLAEQHRQIGRKFWHWNKWL